MADIFTMRGRSALMAKVRSEGNRTTELRLVRLFRQYKIVGWRRHWPVTGKPDFVFPGSRLAVFVDGCFWHGCPRHGTRPKQNAKFWAEKINRNKTRDRKINRLLRSQGWRVLRIWEHELTRKNEGRLVARVVRVIGFKTGRTPEAIYKIASDNGIPLKPTNQSPYG